MELILGHINEQNEKHSLEGLRLRTKQTLTNGLGVAAQHVLIFGPLLLNAALDLAEGSLHSLRKALLDLLVVRLHLRSGSNMLKLVGHKSRQVISSDLF